MSSSATIWLTLSAIVILSLIPAFDTSKSIQTGKHDQIGIVRFPITSLSQETSNLKSISDKSRVLNVIDPDEEDPIDEPGQRPGRPTKPKEEGVKSWVIVTIVVVVVLILAGIAACLFWCWWIKRRQRRISGEGSGELGTTTAFTEMGRTTVAPSVNEFTEAQTEVNDETDSDSEQKIVKKKRKGKKGSAKKAKGAKGKKAGKKGKK